MAYDFDREKLFSSTIRIGDLAGLMICAQYKKIYEQKNIQFEYVDKVHKSLKAHVLFQNTVDTFLPEEYKGLDIYDPGNIWVTAPYYYRKYGVTVLPKLTLEDSLFTGPNLDWGNYVVFAPLTDAEYTTERNMSRELVVSIIDSLWEKFGDNLIVITKDRTLIPNESINKIVTDNLYDIIYIIGHARTFIGGDSGFTHFAGLLRVPAMVSIYHRQCFVEHYILRTGFDRPFSLQGQFIKEPFDSRPNIDPDQTKYINLIMENHRLSDQDFEQLLDFVTRTST